MIEREIAATDRRSFFSRFSKLHDGALVSVRVEARDEVIDQPFHGLSTDADDVIVNTRDHGHRVLHVKKVRLVQTDEGADAGIAMTSDDGTRTDVCFRSPMRAEVLDPLVE